MGCHAVRGGKIFLKAHCKSGPVFHWNTGPLCTGMLNGRRAHAAIRGKGAPPLPGLRAAARGKKPAPPEVSPAPGGALRHTQRSRGGHNAPPPQAHPGAGAPALRPFARSAGRAGCRQVYSSGPYRYFRRHSGGPVCKGLPFAAPPACPMEREWPSLPVARPSFGVNSPFHSVIFM